MRLINADKIDFNEVFKGASDFAKDTREAAHGLIDEQPTIEAVPAVHGEWIDNGIPNSMLSKCNMCGYPCGAYSFNFCPNCGAKMDGK